MCRNKEADLSLTINMLQRVILRLVCNLKQVKKSVYIIVKFKQLRQFLYKQVNISNIKKISTKLIPFNNSSMGKKIYVCQILV